MKKRTRYLYFPETVSPDEYLRQFKESGLNNLELSKKDDVYLTIRLIACVSFMYFSVIRRDSNSSSVNSASLRSLLGKYSSIFIEFVCSVGLPRIFYRGQNYKVGVRPQEYLLKEEFRGVFKPVSIFDEQDIEELFAGYLKKRDENENPLVHPVPELKSIASQISVDHTDYDAASEKYVERKKASNETYELNEAQLRLEIVTWMLWTCCYYF